MKRRCLIIDDMHSALMDRLEELGIETDYLPEIKRSDILEKIQDYEGLVLRSKIAVDKEFIDKAEKLQFIARAGSGMDKIDVEYLKLKNIKVVNAPEGNRDAVSEHTLAMILSLLHKIYKANREVKQYTWAREQNRGTELKGKVVTLFGFGFMGKAVSKRLKSFDCEVLAFDKYLYNFSNKTVKESPLEEIYEKTDILSLHVPLTTETMGMVKTDFIDRFKKPIWLINTSRGRVVKLKDLLTGINEGKINGAALDVLENENPAAFTEEERKVFDDLVKTDKVMFTPHIAGWTYESYKKISTVLAEKIEKVLL